MVNVFFLKDFIWMDSGYHSRLDGYPCTIIGVYDEWTVGGFMFYDEHLITNFTFESRELAKKAIEDHIKRYFSQFSVNIDIDAAARKAFEAAQGVTTWDDVGEYSKEIYRKMVKAIFDISN